MKAVIMAGGEGSRLRPLTCDLPKPLVRLCGKPILHYILELLERHGCEEAAITVGYLSQHIIDDLAEHPCGFTVRPVEETRPLGTAGGVKHACDAQREPILVISGDAMCDFDLSAALRAHRERQADVTILVKSVEDPREYGVIEANEQGKITAFLEKPAYAQATSDLANTGIYILSPSALDMIPKDTKYDFASDLFPAMLREGKKLMIFRDDGYWCDIGDLASYIRCQQDMLLGRVDCRLEGSRDADGNLFAGEKPRGNYSLTAPCYIGREVELGDDVRIERSVLDDGCRVAENSRVSDAVLLQNSSVGGNVRITGSLLCRKSTVRQGAMLFECATLGSESVLGKRSVLKPQIKVWPGRMIGDDMTVCDHVKRDKTAKQYFDDRGICGETDRDMTPEFCTRIGAALAAVCGGNAAVLCCEDTAAAQVLKDAAACGLQSAGADVYDIGSGVKGELEYAVSLFGLSLGIYLSGGTDAVLHIVCDHGLPATRSVERAVESSLLRGEFRYLAAERFGEKVDMRGVGHLYRSALQRLAPDGLAGLSCRIRCANERTRMRMEQVLQRLGVNTARGAEFHIDADGETLYVTGTKIGVIPYERLLLLLAGREFRQGRDIALPFDAPRIIDTVAAQYARSVYRYFRCPADDSDREAREKIEESRFTRDAWMMLVKLLALCKAEQQSLAELVRELPAFHRKIKEVPLRQSPAPLLRAFDREKEANRITEGVSVQLPDGFALLWPEKKGTRMKIIAEAHSMEIAEEICDKFCGRIRQESEK